MNQDTTTVGERLRAALAELSPQERRVGRALLANYPHAGLSGTEQLASSASVSAPTVSRFARSLGFDGYRELRDALLTELADRQASPVSRYTDTRSTTADIDPIKKSLQVTEQAIADTFQHLPHSEFHRAVELLSEPRRKITTHGGRYSRILAHYLAMHLQQIRPRVAWRGSNLASGYADMIDVTSQDVYVLFDVRRYERTTVELATKVHDHKGKLIVVTDPWLSPAAGTADVVLPASIASSSPFDSLAPAFILTELLIDAVLAKRGNHAVSRIKAWDQATDYETLP